MTLFIVLAAGLGFLILNQKIGMASPQTDNSNPAPKSFEVVPGSVMSNFDATNITELPDCEPENQGGNWNVQSDDAFWRASKRFGVPFALQKAHAIRESALKQNAYRLEPSGKASYGLMQILWWKNSNRFKKWGYSDDDIGDGSILYDPYINTELACRIILDNWSRTHDLRDAVNMYNTGVDEDTRKAPGNYVDNVISYYKTLVSKSIT